MQSYNSESPEGERAAKRARASRPKVKSGCRTCKNRRVKCDEGKPVCLRCSRSGRDCYGYVEPPSGRAVAMVLIKPRIPSVNLISPNVSVHATEEESRYFENFRERSSKELSGFFKNDFWTTLVLQESQATTPIRHGVIAIGALTKSLETAPGHQLKVNIIQTVDKTHHENAVLHSLKAIQTLNQYISTSSSPQFRVALISCLLFVTFETLQGSIASSVQQTYGGLKILRGYYVGKPGFMPRISRRTTPNVTDTSEKINKALQIRPGCNKVYQERTMTDHIEEYLASEDEVKLELKDTPIGKVNGFTTEKENAFTYDPRAREVNYPLAKIDINLKTEQRRMIMPLNADEKVVTGLKRSLPSQTPSPPILQNDLTIEEALIQTFVRLDGQGLFFGMKPGIPPLIWDIHRLHHFPIPQRFTDFFTAHRCWDFLQDRALQFYRRFHFNKTFTPDKCETPAQIARKHALHVKQLSDFEKAFKHILNEAVEPSGKVRNPAALVVSLYQKITLITLATVITDSEMVYDDFLPEFQYITRTCNILIASQDATKLPKNARFSFEVGVVPPLHVTATKCRDPVIRREAIDILFASPRQEGIWDGVLTARIGTWLLSCEEDGLSQPPLGSRESSISHSLSESDSLALDRLQYPSPPQFTDEIFVIEGWEKKTSTPQSFNVVEGLTEYESTSEGGKAGNLFNLRPAVANGGLDQRRKQSIAIGNENGAHAKGWKVPEENRVQLMGVDFHIPDRYIKVKCQKALLREDGSREKRETVIAW